MIKIPVENDDVMMPNDAKWCQKMSKDVKMMYLDVKPDISDYRFYIFND